jgi:hypothetical protein
MNVTTIASQHTVDSPRFDPFTGSAVSEFNRRNSTWESAAHRSTTGMSEKRRSRKAGAATAANCISYVSAIVMKRFEADKVVRARISSQGRIAGWERTTSYAV